MAPPLLKADFSGNRQGVYYRLYLATEFLLPARLMSARNFSKELEPGVPSMGTAWDCIQSSCRQQTMEYLLDRPVECKDDAPMELLIREESVGLLVYPRLALY